MWQPDRIDVFERLPVRASTLANRPSQRVLDLVLAVPALVLTSPLILLGALMIVVTSHGGALYRAKRAGVGGCPFQMYKLRTMVAGDVAPGQRITAREDARVTKVGKVLRATKIDELPQLWNVVRGEMSLIGPRPEDYDITREHYDEEMRLSLRVRPGMTSAASLYWYPDLMFHDPPPPGFEDQQWYLSKHMLMELRMDVHYELQRTLSTDISLLLMTPITILRAQLLEPRRRTVEARIP